MRTGGEMYTVLLPLVGEERAINFSAMYEKAGDAFAKNDGLVDLPAYLIFPAVALLYGSIREQARQMYLKHPAVAEIMPLTLLDQLVAVAATPHDEKVQADMGETIRRLIEDAEYLGDRRVGRA